MSQALINELNTLHEVRLALRVGDAPAMSALPAIVGRTAEIAYHSTRSDIECYCNRVVVGSDRWYDLLSPTRAEEVAVVKEAVSWLDQCGMLVYSGASRTMVQIREWSTK